MIEIATGAAFLLSSLYGAGQVNAATASATAPVDKGQAASSQTASTSQATSTIDVEAYVRKAYADEPILVDIASCESAFRQFDQNGGIVRGKVNQSDIGVMQINEYYHADEAKKLGDDLYTLQGNVSFAKHLYEKYGTDPWASSEKCWSDMSGIASK